MVHDGFFIISKHFSLSTLGYSLRWFIALTIALAIINTAKGEGVGLDNLYPSDFTIFERD